jgi:hypothetical protein
VTYFNEHGRCLPSKGARVFSGEPSYYYQLKQPEINYQKIYDRCSKYSDQLLEIGADTFASKSDTLLEKIKQDSNYTDLMKGIHIPFIFKRNAADKDLGLVLQNSLLQNVKKSFNDVYPEAHFKAVLQSNSELAGNITVARGSNYEELITSSEDSELVGWYFPQALQEFDVDSQRKQLSALPKINGAKICLSGGFDMCAALVGSPELLINEESYAPILCMSSYVHSDERLVLLLKSYGPHMEFLCMTQMLTKNIKQVSEQWSGGLTVFN